MHSATTSLPLQQDEAATHQPRPQQQQQQQQQQQHALQMLQNCLTSTDGQRQALFSAGQVAHMPLLVQSLSDMQKVGKRIFCGA